MLSEGYITSQLLDAIASSSADMLHDAILLAEKTRNTTLGEYQLAKAAFADLSTRKETLGLLQSELECSTSASQLIARADKIEKLVKRLQGMGLGGEPSVQDALGRFSRIQNLFFVRNSIRQAVELCSLEEIKSAMAQRSELVSMYGNELFATEVEAVRSLCNLLVLEELFYPSAEEWDSTLPRLPMYIRTHLDTMKASQNEFEILEASDKFNLMVPDYEDRKMYRRVFKWVVAVAVWR